MRLRSPSRVPNNARSHWHFSTDAGGLLPMPWTYMTVFAVLAPADVGASSTPSLWMRSPISASAARARRPERRSGWLSTGGVARLGRRVRLGVLGVRGWRAMYSPFYTRCGSIASQNSITSPSSNTLKFRRRSGREAYSQATEQRKQMNRLRAFPHVHSCFLRLRVFVQFVLLEILHLINSRVGGCIVTTAPAEPLRPP